MNVKPGKRKPAVRALTAVAGLVGALIVMPSAAQAAITPDAAVEIKAGHSNKCLNVDHALTADDTKIIQYNCSPSFTNDKFRVVPKGSGTYQIVAQFSGKCLNVYKNALVDNTPVHQYTCSDTAKNNLWKFLPVAGNTTYRIQSVASNKCLNVYQASQEINAAVNIYTCGTVATTLNDQFYFPPATSASITALPTTVAPVAAGQAGVGTAAVGALVYGFVDTLGTLWRGYQSDPETFSPVWQAVPGNERFTGHVSVNKQADGRAQISARNATDGDLNLMTQSAKDANTWYGLGDAGGSSSSNPVQGVLPDGKLVDFELVNGQLWRSAQDGTNFPYGGWRYIGGSGLTGEPALAPTRDGLRVFALDANGALQTATYAGGVLSDWTSLGGTGLNGKPAVVIRPGYAVRIVIRSADGTIVTKAQNDDGTFQAAWTPVPDLVAAGAPAAVMDPVTGKVGIVARAADNTIYYTGETGQNTGVFGAWVQPYATQVVTDPSVVVYDKTSGRGWAYIVRDANNKVYAVTAGEVPGSLAAARKSAAAAASAPAFTEHALPALPTK
ncbi:RICIN domain-containing protein [Actinoplanes sp. CA-030573]|uniref:RICIN domain-containing protein n=1 Tax=Actinoplanes sp. CA-030573 TaxID=3239898 RepID=UPI003D8B08F1